MTQTPLSPGLVARAVRAARYVISGVAPDAWFGPLQPMEPMAPPEVAGRRFDYPTGYNLDYTPRSYNGVSFDELRALADNCDIVRSVIETRKDQIEAQEWTVRVAAKETSAKVPVATDDQKRRIDAILAFLHSPDKEHGFDQWLRQILEDMFVIDGVAIYKRRNRAGGFTRSRSSTPPRSSCCSTIRPPAAAARSRLSANPQGRSRRRLYARGADVPRA